MPVVGATPPPLPPLEIAKPDPAAEARLVIEAGGAGPVDPPALIAALRAADRFDLARKLLELWRAPPHADRGAEPRPDPGWLVRQHAFCTYRDRELPAEERFRRAWRILEESADLRRAPDPRDLELAGTLHRAWWMLDGRRERLEQAAAWYRRSLALAPGDGGAAVNAAFVLDLLAEDADNGPATARARRDEAERLRTGVLAALLPSADPEPSWRFCTTVAEAYFGLRRFEEARTWLRRGLARDPDAAEREGIARQLGRIFLLGAERADDRRAATDALSVLYPSGVDLTATAFTGKVGLALSGGGFRASLFHLSVLARLAEADVLRHVEVLSCVSGGSIVGAHYYLALKRLLESRPDAELGADDYVALVRRVASTFVRGVEGNLRMRILASPLATMRMLLRSGESRSTRLGRLYETRLFDAVRGDAGPGRPAMQELRIFPHGDAEFRPATGNWRRRNRVPVVVLNATTLNTGHSWQFTAAWMGEPPGPIDSDVDGNEWLRRVRYARAPEAHRGVPLGVAVAASACVPGLFTPVELAGLYDGRSVRLVDGGVHDNQGIATLVEQQCTLVIVSDASGQMTSIADPAAHGALPVARSNTILQARVRQAQVAEMDQRRAAGVLRGFCFLHLLRGISPPAVDWIGCDEPEATYGDRGREQGDPLPYGMPVGVQRRLAAIRTDLDAFHRAEAYALMSSGYRMADAYVDDAFGADAPVAAAPRREWFFQQIDPIIDEGPEGDRHRRLLELLDASSAVAFKPWRIAPVAAWSATLALVAGTAAALVVAGALLPRAVTVPIGSVVALAAASSAAAFLLGHARWGRRPAVWLGRIASPVVAAVGAAVSLGCLAVLNPIYLRAGRLGMDAPPEEEPGGVRLASVGRAA
jgi:predicted acylesterase/phospholipase RssA